MARRIGWWRIGRGLLLDVSTGFAGMLERRVILLEGTRRHGRDS
jgi:hypothetical protein